MTALLVALTLGLPLLLATAAGAAALLDVALPGSQQVVRAAVVRWSPLAVVPAALLALLPADGPVVADWLLLGAVLQVDLVARPLLALTALGYGLALAFAARADDERAVALSCGLLVCAAGNAAVFLAGDAATFYLGFAVMSFAGYVLVVHTRSDDAKRASRIYLVMTVLGEVAVLSAVLLTVEAGGYLLADAPAAVATSPHRDLVIGLLLAGFGVKAGTVPLHVWLPLAHPAAPTPASAVLSGVMVKAGLVGWLRFLPLGEGSLPGWGAVFVVGALLGGFLAVPIGLLQGQVKVVLAYSSISQMGFLTVLVGVALAEPALAAGCVAAAVLYAVHHGLAKSALFLGIATWGEHGGSRWRPVVLVPLVVAALSVVGAPLTSGYVAKYVAKESVAGATTGIGVALADVLPWVGVGSTLLLARAGWLLLGQPAGQQRRVHLPLLAWAAVAVGGLAVVAPLVAPLGVGDLAPSLTDAGAWWDQSWPLLLGLLLVGLGVVVSVRDLVPAWLAHPDGRTVPPGDVVVWEERVVERVLRRVLRLTAWLGVRVHRVGAAVRSTPSAMPLVLAVQRRTEPWAASGVVLLVAVAAALLVGTAGLW